jgi:hypothetical protein
MSASKFNGKTRGALFARLAAGASAADAARASGISAATLRAWMRRAGARRPILPNDRAGGAVVVCRRASDGELTPYPKTARRRIPLSARAQAALDELPPRLDTQLLFPAARRWLHRPRRLAHAAGMSIFQLSRLMGASVWTIDKHYGHLAHDPEDAIRALLDSRGRRSGVFLASDES